MRRASLSPQELSENNVLLFLRQPRTIARILAGLFSLIIFASLVTDGYQNLTTSSQLRCVLNDNWVACSYAITAGVLAFLQSFLFLVFDAYDNIIISHKVKSVILSLDLTFSIIWSCVWFVGFCFLANQWNRSAHHYLLGSSSASASIAFAFFSIPCWVYLGYRALRGLWAERPISYKQSLDEGTVALTTLSSVTTTSIPNSMEYHSPIEGRRASSTPTEGRRASSTPTEGRRASSTPTEGRRASSTPTQGRRASSTPFPQTPMGNQLTHIPE